MVELDVNGRMHRLDLEPEMPLLWVLRDELHLTGTKFGCGAALCGACTVEVDGAALRSCVVPVGAVAGRRVRTIEGEPDAVVAALQQAWLAQQVPQCGYCQGGMILAAASLLRRDTRPAPAAIDAAVTNLCRCGTYQRVRAAILQAAASLAEAQAPSPPAGPAKRAGP